MTRHCHVRWHQRDLAVTFRYITEQEICCRRCNCTPGVMRTPRVTPSEQILTDRLRNLKSELRKSRIRPLSASLPSSALFTWLLLFDSSVNPHTHTHEHEHTRSRSASTAANGGRLLRTADREDGLCSMGMFMIHSHLFLNATTKSLHRPATKPLTQGDRWELWWYL